MQELAASYFDGRSAQAHAVTLRLADGVLHIVAADSQEVLRSVQMRDVQWPERTRHGKRVAHLAGGGLVQTDDTVAWDTWVAANGQHESLVVKMQQSWRTVLASAVILICLIGAVYAWGLPLLSDVLVEATPASVDQSLGEAALTAVDAQLMAPTQLSADEQSRIQEAWKQVVAAQAPEQVPQWELVFRKSKIGPNAFALPGGTMVMTDEMVKLVDGDTQVLSAILGHELGHLQHRDSLRMLIQVGVLGSISSVALGDFSSVMATVPVLLGQAGYSREAEHAADVYSVQVMKAAHISPAVMVVMFDKMAERNREKAKGAAKDGDAEEPSWLGIAFASHPADAERIAFFKQAAQ